MERKVIDYSSAFLKLNVSGKRYKILKTTAFRFRNSLFDELARLDRGSEEAEKSLSPAAATCFYLVDSNEFYLERSATVFGYVLHFLYTDTLHCPNGVCKEMLMKEMKFWRLITPDNEEDVKVAQCCEDGRRKKADEDDEQKREEEEEMIVVQRPKTFCAKVWVCCEEPRSSVLASLVNLLSIFFIIVSIVNLLLSTVKSLHHCKQSSNSTVTMENDLINFDNETDLSIPMVSFSLPVGKRTKCEGGPIFDLIESICIGWFTLELIVRFIACPQKGRFFKSTLNIIDLLATIPFYIELILWALKVNTKVQLMIYVFRILRILRIMRALRLARYFDSVRMMGETLKKCRKDLSVLVVFIFMAMIISSSVIYYFERDEEDTPFTSIPTSFWWCIVTLTTVGYGDITPSTSGGRVCAGIVCVMGIILMAMPISIMVEHFGDTYKTRVAKTRRAQVRELLKKVTSGDKEDEETKLIKYDQDERGMKLLYAHKNVDTN